MRYPLLLPRKFTRSTPGIVFIFCISIAIYFFASDSNQLQTTTGDESLYTVVKVIDGDTIDVVVQGKTERLRLIGVDTPETVDPRKTVQCFGVEASNKAKEILNGQRVKIEADVTQGNRDKYGRLLRYVFLADDTNFNQRMIEDGYAHEYTYNVPHKYQTDFMAAEKNAREKKLGLWSDETCAGNTNS